MIRLIRPAFLAVLVGSIPTVTGAQNTPPQPRAVTEVKVKIGDVLRIKLWPDEKYSGDYTVESSGAVTVPFLGEFQAGGKTIVALRTEFHDRYEALTKGALVVVSLMFRVSVLGEVRVPGLFPADASHTIFDAISLAGGFTSNALTSDIRLLRDDHVVVLNARRAFESAGPDLGVLLQSGDRIVVPEKETPRVTWQLALTVLQTVGLIVALVKRH
jgi:protein involved in polysaccharide export with SLBB domain